MIRWARETIFKLRLLFVTTEEWKRELAREKALTEAAREEATYWRNSAIMLGFCWDVVPPRRDEILKRKGAN